MTTKPHIDAPRTPWTNGITVPGDGWVHVNPGARELFNDTALVPGWRRIASEGPDQDGDFALFGSDNATTYQFVRATDCEVQAPASTPENTRLLRTNELPPNGSRVYVPEDTASVVGDRPEPGWQHIRATDETDSSIAVKSENGRTSWVLSHNLLVEDEDRPTVGDETRRPTVGDRVRIDAPDRPTHGQAGEVIEHDGTDLPYYVRLDHADAEWFYAHQVSPVSDEPSPVEVDATTATTVVSVTHTTTVTLPRPATAKQVADALAYVDGDHEVTVQTYADRIEIIGTHRETRG